MNEPCYTYKGPIGKAKIYRWNGESNPSLDDYYECPNDCFYLAYRGSVAHGTRVASTGLDDIDLMGFCFGPKEVYLGLEHWGQHGKGTKEVKQGSFDVVLYEIRKAFQLLLQGNPNILTMLWVDPQWTLERGYDAERIVKNRHLFSGKHVYNAFAGYASAQLQKMTSRDPAELREYLAVTAELKYRGEHPNEKGNFIGYPEGYDWEHGEGLNAFNTSTDILLTKLRSYQKKGENLGYLGAKRKGFVLDHGFDRKNAAHLVRLLRQRVEYLKTGELIVNRGPVDAQELIDIKLGNGWPLEQIKEHAEDLFKQAKAARDASPLPEGPDIIGVQKLLVSMLEDHFGYCPF